MASNFYSQRSLEGWDIAYSSDSGYEVGVIDPDLLPSNSLIYRYYFLLNPRPSQGAGSSFGSFTAGIGLGGPVVDIARDSIAYDLDFVVSNPVWNQLILATSDNINGNELTLPNHVLDVAYVIKVTVDNEGNVNEVLDISNENPRNISDLPKRPNLSDGKSVWFEFYQSFQDNGDWAGYNRFQAKLGSKDADYTFHHVNTNSHTNSKRIRVQNLTEGDYYLITYEAVTDHLFRHHVEVEFEQYIFVLLGASLSPPPFPTALRTAHYLWKEWTDDDGIFHEGWRLSESWNMDIASHQLQNESVLYDPISNPLIGKERYVEWSLFNMVEENLKKKDKDRVGYNRFYAEYLNDLSKKSTLTQNQALQEDTNNINENNVHPSNFEIEYVADNRVNYSGSAAAWAVIETGGALGVLFNAPYGSYGGHFESAFYKRKFPRNTRLVSAYSRIRFGPLGRVIAVKMQKGSEHVSVVEDPFFFMTIKNNLYYHYFNDSLGRIQLADRMSKTQEYVQYRYPDNVILTGSVGGTLPGTVVSPGRNILLSSNENSANTYIDGSALVTDPTRYDVMSSTLSFTKYEGSITDVTEIYSDRPEGASKVFRVDTDNTASVIGSLLIKLSDADGGNQSALLRIRGESGQQIREMVNVAVPIGREVKIDLGAWQSIDYLIIFSDVNCVLDRCDRISLSETVDSQYHLVDNISSMAATTDSKGNFTLFYTDRDGRLNSLLTGNAGHSWTKYESILIRGDKISDVRGVPNMMQEEFFLFHFYKDALLCVPMDITLFMLPSSGEKKVEALDSIRRQACYLVWGNAIKPEDQKQTQYDADGNIIFEDLNDNVIFTEEDRNTYQSKSRSVQEISSSENANVEIKSLNDGNKFIYIGKKTANNGLAQSSPIDREYSVYRNRKGAFRLVIAHEDSNGTRTYRNLTSWDNGLNWEDGWRYTSENTEEQVVRINYLSKGQETEEGTKLSLLYNEEEDKVYMFYFYQGSVLCKPVSDVVFDMNDWDEQIEVLNNLSIYAIAGNLQTVVGESNYEEIPEGENRNIVFNSFQRNLDNLNKYYSDEIYEEQYISGYLTDHGYMRIFLVNTENNIDGYIYDGNVWMPEKIIVN